MHPNTPSAEQPLRRAASRLPARARLALSLVTAALLASLPFLGASAQPAPHAYGSASASAPASALAPASASAAQPTPPVAEPLSAATLAGSSKAPLREEWVSARALTGVRRGRWARDNDCVITHVREWVRVSCAGLSTARVDLLSGEARDLQISVGEARWPHGDDLAVRFSMRPGDRRVIQWIEPDTWISVWDHGTMASGHQLQGPMYGMVVQVDWASGPEPTITMY